MGGPLEFTNEMILTIMLGLFGVPVVGITALFMLVSSLRGPISREQRKKKLLVALVLLVLMVLFLLQCRRVIAVTSRY